MATDTPTIEVAHRWDHGCSWKVAGSGMLACRSHVLRDGDRLWLVDPIDGIGLDELLEALGGEVAGVVVLLDRHLRDAVSLARRYRCRLLVPPGRWRPGHPAPDGSEPLSAEVEGCPFRFDPVVERRGQWLEWSLWWAEQRTLLVAEAVGSANYYLASGDEQLAVHPLLRVLGAPASLATELVPSPVRILVGHGDVVEGKDIEQELRRAIGTARSTLPAFAARSALEAARSSGGWLARRLRQVRDA